MRTAFVTILAVFSSVGGVVSTPLSNPKTQLNKEPQTSDCHYRLSSDIEFYSLHQMKHFRAYQMKFMYKCD
jgi:hypothetical protein